VVHEWGYFFVVGAQFQTLVSATDYLANSILWLPQMLALLGGGYIGAYGLTRISPRNERQQGGRVLQFVITFAATFVVSLADPLVGVPFLLVWAVFLGTEVYFRWRPELRNTLSMTMRHVMVGLPLVPAAAFGLGALEAQGDLRSTKDLFRIERKDAQVEVNLLRSFDRGILVSNITEKRIEFMRWDEVRTMSIAREALKEPKERWPVCLIFKACPSM
jgi:hypothetical protein